MEAYWKIKKHEREGRNGKEKHLFGFRIRGIRARKWNCFIVGVFIVLLLFTWDFFVIVVSHSFLFSGRSLRYQKRYMALPSPLTAIKFWRVSSSDVHVEKKLTRLNCLRFSNVFAFYLLFLRFV